jgi:hypothetical protein
MDKLKEIAYSSSIDPLVSEEDAPVPPLCTPENMKTTLLVGLGTFCVYFCIYGFRKPWGAAKFRTEQ